MDDESDILELIEDIYDAALDESRWPSVMQKVLTFTESRGASFCIIDSSETTRLPTFIGLNFDPEMLREYVNGVVAQDPTVQHIVAHPHQKIVHDTAIISESEKDRHPYYAWHEHYSDTRHRLAGMVNPGPGIQSGITVHRTRAQGDFDAALKRRFALVYRHLEKAIAIGFRLGTLTNVQNALLDLLDNNPTAIALFDQQGRIIIANKAMCEVIAAREGVVLEKDRLRLARSTDDRRFQQLLARALLSRGDATVAPGGTMQALRSSGKRPYSVTVSPLGSRNSCFGDLRLAGCVAIADPERDPVSGGERLQALYGLTPAEASLAARLAQGDDLRGSALALGIQYATARSQLAAIFRKTGTRRQGELIKLLLSSLPQVNA